MRPGSGTGPARRAKLGRSTHARWAGQLQRAGVVDGSRAAPHHSGVPLTRDPRALQPDRPTQAPSAEERPEPSEGAERVRGRVARLLLAWAVLAAGMFLLRAQIDDRFWRALLLPMAFGAVIALAVVTVRMARFRTGAMRRSAERRRVERREKGREAGDGKQETGNRK